MPRNRQLTAARIRGAARELLRNEGFAAWGVNRIAREAGVDKVLLYRYFDSLDGLLAAVVAETAFWPDPDDLPDHSPEAFIEASLRHCHDQPEIPVLLTNPATRAPHSAVRRKFSADLDGWLKGFRSRTDGNASPDQLERLPALILHSLTTGRDLLSPRELWRLVAPPLEWRSQSTHEVPEDLPPELL